MSDMRERFDDMDLRTKNLGATVAGALAGGFAGRAAGKSRLTMLAGAAAGALGGQAIATRNVDRYDDIRNE
jgi:outer membrane lipoprotein SlyB